MTKFFNHAYGGNAIGRVDKNGKVYDNERLHYGKCIGCVDKDGKVKCDGCIMEMRGRG